MQTYTKGDLDVSYTYDADGLRTSKTVDGATTTYQYVGDKLYYLCAKDADGNTSYEMYFFYDSYDKLTVLKYFLHTVEDENNVVKEFTYYVATNYFGDVVGLYDGAGKILNSYEYDAWGNVIGVYKHEHSTDDEGKPVISTVENTDLNSIAHRNPIRYRSYYYDLETGLYYLQSRYYNPEIGRFLNADGYISTGIGVIGYNMFAYCNNSPIITIDENGDVLCTILGATIGAITSVLFKSLETDSPEELKAAAINGAISGAISGAVADVMVVTGGSAGAFIAAGAIAGAAGSVSGQIAENMYLDIPTTTEDVVSNAIVGGFVGGAFGALSPTKESLKKTLIKAGTEITTRNIVKKTTSDFTKSFVINTVTEVVSNFFSWFLGLPFNTSKGKK